MGLSLWRPRKPGWAWAQLGDRVDIGWDSPPARRSTQTEASSTRDEDPEGEAEPLRTSWGGDAFRRACAMRVCRDSDAPWSDVSGGPLVWIDRSSDAPEEFH